MFNSGQSDTNKSEEQKDHSNKKIKIHRGKFLFSWSREVVRVMGEKQKRQKIKISMRQIETEIANKTKQSQQTNQQRDSSGEI